MNENPSSETLADGAHVTPADGGETVESPSLSLAELNKHLGADFKDTETALQSLKETKNFVGKRKEDIAAEVRSQLQPALQQNDSKMASKSDVQELKNQLFFSENKQYKDYEPLITKLGSDPSEVVKSEEFKSIFEKAKVADEVVRNKSVVSSNPRLSQAKTVVETAVNIANARGTTNEDVALVFAQELNQLNNQ